jgi:hypothetical protein
MELPHTSRPAVDRGGGRAPAYLGIAGLVLYALLIWHYSSGVPAGSDQAGYFNHARLIASGTVHAAERALPGLPPAKAPWFLYVPLGFKPTPGNLDMVPTYPPGLPLLILAARTLVGWRFSADLVLVVHSLAGVLLTWFLGRALGLTRLWAALGAVIVAASPLYLFFSVEAMSDMPSMVWIAAAALAAWQSQEKPVRAAAAGSAFAFAILLRPTNALAIAPLLVALGWPSGGAAALARRWLFFVLGGLPFAVFFCLHSGAAYGSWFATGYGDVGYDFGMRWVGVTLAHDAHWLPILFTPVVCLAPGLPWAASKAQRAAATLAVWIAVYIAFYATYRSSHEAWWYLRFLLPAAPALVIAGLLVLRLALEASPLAIPRAVKYALAVCFVCGPSVYWSNRLHVFSIPRGEAVYSRAAEWMKANLPPDAVIFCSQTSAALYYSTDFTLIRWDSVTPASKEAVMAAVRACHQPAYAALFPFETEGALGKVLPGHWTQVGDLGHVSVWRLDSP